MNIRSYNIVMILATAIAWSGFFIIINNFDPDQASIIVFLLFYFVLFLSILGTLSLLGFWLRGLWNRQRGIMRVMVLDSFRQSIIFSAVLVIALWLQSMRVLTWWNMVILVVLATVVETVILLFKQSADKKMQ